MNMDSKLYHLTFSSDTAGTKLSQFLSDQIPHLSHTQAKLAIQNGLVSVNGTVQTDILSVCQPDEAILVDLRHGATPRARTRHTLRNIEIVYEDKDLIVVNKPAGILVHPTDESERGTLLELIHRYWRKGKKPHSYLKVVHRIDKETSGLVVFPKNALSHRLLSLQFKDHLVERTYTAIVHGHVRPEQGQYESFIVQETKHTKRRGSSGEADVGKKAVTRYQVRRYFPDYTLVDCWLETGRTHQIRIHFSEAGHPLLGEEVYISKELRRYQRFRRQALHAGTLRFCHPSTGEMVDFSVDLPPDMTRFIQRMSPQK